MFDFTVPPSNIWTAVTALLISVFFLEWIRKRLFRGNDIDEGYVLVTGCDTGFGYDTALQLSRRNMFVFAGCLTLDGVDRLNQDVEFRGLALPMDVSNEADVERVKTIIKEEVKGKGLWSVVNNAGINKLGPVEWLRVAQMKQVMDINHWGTVNVTKAMLPLVKRARGRIVNMSSIFGRTTTLNMSAYCMAKYAIEAFSDCLRYEMEVWGVSVHIIEPGSHSTGFISGHEKVWDELWHSQPSNIQEEYGESFRRDIIVGMQKKAEKISADPKNVVDAYCHAVVSSRPKTRYVVGVDANTVGVALATLPTCIGDILRKLMTDKVVPAAMKKK